MIYEWLWGPKRPLIDPLPANFYGPDYREDIHARDIALHLAIDVSNHSVDHMSSTEIVVMASRFYAFLTGIPLPDDVARECSAK